MVEPVSVALDFDDDEAHLLHHVVEHDLLELIVRGDLKQTDVATDDLGVAVADLFGQDEHALARLVVRQANEQRGQVIDGNEGGTLGVQFEPLLLESLHAFIGHGQVCHLALHDKPVNEDRCEEVEEDLRDEDLEGQVDRQRSVVVAAAFGPIERVWVPLRFDHQLVVLVRVALEQD